MNKPQTTPTVTRADLIAAIEIAQDAVTGPATELNLYELANSAKIESDRIKNVMLIRAAASDYRSGVNVLMGTLQPSEFDIVAASAILENSAEVAAAREIMPQLLQARDDAREALREFDAASERTRAALRDALAASEAAALADPAIAKLRAEVEAMTEA